MCFTYLLSRKNDYRKIPFIANRKDKRTAREYLFTEETITETMKLLDNRNAAIANLTFYLRYVSYE